MVGGRPKDSGSGKTPEPSPSSFKANYSNRQCAVGRTPSSAEDPLVRLLRAQTKIDPSRNFTACPESSTRSPRTSQCTSPPLADA